MPGFRPIKVWYGRMESVRFSTRGLHRCKFYSLCLIIFPSVMVSKFDLILPSLIFVCHSFTLPNLLFSPIIFEAKIGLVDHHEIADCSTYCKSESVIIGQC